MENSLQVGNAHVFEAIYKTVDSSLNEYWINNPLIEALPRILTEIEFFTLVTDLPRFDQTILKANPQQRVAQIDQCMRLTVPMTSHLFLKQRFDRVIRDGYGNRNPIKNINHNGLQEKLNLAKELTGYALTKKIAPTSPGFSIIGIGGVGKTHGLDTVMQTYPQVIVHKDFLDNQGNIHHLQRTQIVHLKITCPPDGSLKALCNTFFNAVDLLLGTHYYEDYGTKNNKYRSAAEMVPHMASTAALFSLGVLVIDEIQYLSKQKSGGVELMLHFFSYLMDEIQLPVILVGTPKADDILNGAFWQMRRNAGQGHFEWRRLTRSDERDNKCEWERFLTAVWTYQYCTIPIELVDDLVPKDLSDVLYLESQGIVDFALKLFRLAQERAINDQTETLSATLITDIAKDLFGNMRVVVQGIATGKKPKGLTIDDIKFEIDKNFNKLLDPASKTTSAKSDVSDVKPVQAIKKAALRDTSLPRPLLDALNTAVHNSSDVIEALRDESFLKSAREFGG